MFTPAIGQPGGAAKHSSTLSEGLARRGWRVALVTRDAAGRRLKLSRTPSGVRVLEVPGFGHTRIGAILYLLAAVPAGIVMGGPRASFIGLELAAPSVAAAISGTLLRRPVLSFTFSSGERGELELLEGRRSWPLRRRLLTRAGRVVTQTEFAGTEVAAALPDARLSVLPTPVDPVPGPPALTGSRRVVFTGRLTEQKGLDVLLEAWRTVADEVPDATLTLAGQGGGYGGAWAPVDDELRATTAAHPGLARSVEFAGWVGDVAALMSSCDVYVLPSRSEGMSNALLEACTWGRVPVTSAIEANRAVLGDDYPLLYPVDRPDLLAERLIRALGSAAVRDACRELALDRVSLSHTETVLDRLEEMLREEAARG